MDIFKTPAAFDRTLIMGNGGAGKKWLARRLAEAFSIWLSISTTFIGSPAIMESPATRPRETRSSGRQPSGQRGPWRVFTASLQTWSSTERRRWYGLLSGG